MLKKSIHVSHLTARIFHLFVDRLERDKNTDKDVDADRDRTGRPVGGHWSSQLEEIDINFKVSGLLHAVVKQPENSRIRQLVKKIERHPHPKDLQADLQQTNAYKPFSEKSKKMIRDMGNVELFDNSESAMLRMPSSLESRHRLLYLWTYLERDKFSRLIHRWQLDILSIPNCVIKNGRPHGNRYGKTEEQREHFIAHKLRKRCIKKGFEGIHDRFQNDPEFRESQLSIDRTEEDCIQMDKVAQKDFTYRMSSDE